MGIKKMQNFPLISKLLRKMPKICYKKVIGKKVYKIGVCPLLYF